MQFVLCYGTLDNATTLGAVMVVNISLHRSVFWEACIHEQGKGSSSVRWESRHIMIYEQMSI